MRARISSFYLPLAFLFATTYATDSRAEFRCNAEISYKWVKRVVEPLSSSPAAVPTGSGRGPASTPPAPTTPKPTPEPSIVRLMGVERSGADEAAAKAHLQNEVERQRIRASEACKRDHESYGSCVALKMSGNASTLNSLGFNARAELEKALNEECRQQEGTCLGVDVTEPKCREIATTNAAPAAADGAKAADPKAGANKGGKDTKKK